MKNHEVCSVSTERAGCYDSCSEALRGEYASASTSIRYVPPLFIGFTVNATGRLVCKIEVYKACTRRPEVIPDQSGSYNDFWPGINAGTGEYA